MAVFLNAANISSAMAWRELWMISRVIESCVLIRETPSSAAGRQMNVNVAVVVHAHLVVRMDQHRRTAHLDHSRAFELHAGFEKIAVIDIRGVYSFQRVIHLATPLPGLVHAA